MGLDTFSMARLVFETMDDVDFWDFEDEEPGEVSYSVGFPALPEVFPEEPFPEPLVESNGLGGDAGIDGV